MKTSNRNWIVGLIVLVVLVVIVVFAKTSPVNAPEGNLENASSSNFGQTITGNPFQSTTTPPSTQPLPTPIPPIYGSGITGKVYIGPTCPTTREDDLDCADKPYQGNLAVMTSDGSQVVTTFSSDGYGDFKVAVSPGTYVIQSDPSQGSLYPRCSSDPITVKFKTYTTANVNCDSGIR